jgi:hypothetical protein
LFANEKGEVEVDWRGIKNFPQKLKEHKQKVKEKAKYYFVNELTERDQLREENLSLKEELQIEREEFDKALQKAQEWRERQLNEIKEKKDKEIEGLKKQVSQLQAQLNNSEQKAQIIHNPHKTP